MAIFSPYFGTCDFRWFLRRLGSMEDYHNLNKQLFDYTFAFDIYDFGSEYEMPVYFISGTDDWICPIEASEEYKEYISDLGTQVSFRTIDGCGHSVQYSHPKEFAMAVSELLEGL